MRPRIIIPMNMRSPRGDDSSMAYLKEAYIQLIEQAGAEAYTPPPRPSFDPSAAAGLGCCGLLLTGGADLDAALYGRENHPAGTRLHPLRQQAELAWFAWADSLGLPILGICLGCQLINVARGGSLVQHLPERTRTVHSLPGRQYSRHPISLSGKLTAAIGTKAIEVNSSHHQAVEELGRDLSDAARADDGTIEAIEDTRNDRFVLGVQWHPEDMREEASTLALMRFFLDAGKNYLATSR